MKITNRPKRTSSTLSDFIRNASSRDKKRVYGDVLKKAARSQAEVVKKSG
ncbi:MAG: hypothetical protein ACQETO_11680 [Pseudomonadota bacterium]